MGAIQNDGIRGGPHGGQVPSGIAAVPLVLSTQDFGERYVNAAGGQLGSPAPGALFRVGDEEEFTLGLGKDNGALVAPFAHQIAADSDRPLQIDQEMSNDRDSREPTGQRRYVRRADAAGDVRPVQANHAWRGLQI